MKPKFKVLSFDTREDFNTGIAEQFEDGYIVGSFQIDEVWGIVAMFTSMEALVETTHKMTQLTIKLIAKELKA